jgi:hypothetical protein
MGDLYDEIIVNEIKMDSGPAPAEASTPVDRLNPPGTGELTPAQLTPPLN